LGSVADVSIYDRAEQRNLPVYYHQGRYYVVGKPGNEYQINVRNVQSTQIMAVVSVDGINAITGASADWGQTGYVLYPNYAFDIKGWRKSLKRTAAFYFTELSNSYAARTARPDNVGVIGVALFRPKPVAPAARIKEEEDTQLRRESAASGSLDNRAKDSAPAAAQRPSLGTGHGRNETSVVSYTDFDRASESPDEVIAIYYDSYRNLLAQGVIPAPTLARPSPSPFPGQFVPDPR
jgi:hypothetical protein